MRPVDLFAVLFFGHVAYFGVTGDETSTFQKLVQDYWEWRLKDAPEFASLFNVNTYNDLVESFTLDILDARKTDMDGFLNQLNKIDSTSLGKTDRVSYKVLKDTLQTFLDGYRWRFYGPMNPVNFLEGFLSDPKGYAIFGDFKTKKDLEDFIQRLKGWANRTSEYVTRMRKAIEMNTTNNWVSESRVLKLFEAFDVVPEHFVLYEPFNETLGNMTIPSQEKQTIRTNAKDAIERLIDGFKNLKTFLTTVYRNETRQAWGVNSFKDGEEYYKACLKWHLSVDMTPEEVHERGLEEVDRIHKRMITIMDRFGFNGSVSEFFADLRNDSKFIINDPDETIREFKEIIFTRVKPKLPKYFKNIPDMPVNVVKMPYDGPGGQYAAGSPDGSRPGKFQVNVIRPQDNPTFDMVALTLHEADPGHHLQDIFSQASSGLPEFRKVFDDHKYYSAPYFFPFYTAYVEGWALYAEALGEKDELDIYKDDYELMGRYSSEIFRACRLVVDTGLHHYNWSRDKAIEFMLNYTSYTKEAMAIEIDRYITWPGQACAYKIGELKIWEQRRRAESYLGNLFDIRGFHSVILDNGAVPLNVLEDLVTEWMHEVVAANTEKAFISITKEFWEWRQEQEPELSTFSGGYKYNDKLESYKYAVYTERKVKAEMFLSKLNVLNYTKLSSNQQISYDVLKNILITYTEGYKWKDYGNLNPFNFIEGFQKDPSSYTIGIPFDTQGDFFNYVRRIEEFPQQFEEMLDLAKLAVRLGHTDHNVSVNRVPAQFDSVIVDNPVEFVMYKPFNDSAVKLFGENTTYIEHRLITAITMLIKKLKDVKTYISTVYIPKTRLGLGVSHLGNGSDYYKACLKWHTSLDITPEEVHQRGLDEVTRIAKEMKQAMARLNFTASTTIKEAYAAIANDTKFLINDGQKTLERFREIIFQRIQPKLDKYFKNIPELPLVVLPSPTDGISGEYMSGSEDGTIPGIFFANVRRPEDNPTYAMVSLSLHEAIPGHHFAESYGMTSDLPDFRKHYSWRSYSAPFYFPFFNSYVEGWALYAEYLGEEMGVYKDDYELMGRYSDEMWRACRLVIDTGIHYFNWSREQSIGYIMNYTAVTRKTAEIEIDRYTTWPGQACGYKIGEMKIKELRKHAQETLGASFDIRDFHYQILSNGPVPLDVLEKIINNWVTKTTKSQPPTQGQTECNPTKTVNASWRLQIGDHQIVVLLFLLKILLEKQ